MELPSSMCWKPQLALATRRWSEKRQPWPPASACSQSPPPRPWRQEHAWSFRPLSRSAFVNDGGDGRRTVGGGHQTSAGAHVSDPAHPTHNFSQSLWAAFRLPVLALLEFVSLGRGSAS